jgi:hypothetical protein
VTEQLALAFGELPALALEPALRAGRLMLAHMHNDDPPEVVRERIAELTTCLLADPAPVETPLDHEFVDGMYRRTMFIPKGTLLVGKVHAQACFNIVAKGDITVLTEFGLARLTAGYIGVSQAGSQKVGLANEDTVFINVFRTHLTDLAEIEAAIAYAPAVPELNRKELL